MLKKLTDNHELYLRNSNATADRLWNNHSQTLNKGVASKFQHEHFQHHGLRNYPDLMSLCCGGRKRAKHK